MHEERNVLLSKSTTLALGGPAMRFVHVENEKELAQVVSEADARGEKLLVLGGGSNLVVGDAGFDGVVVKIAASRITPDAKAGKVHVSVQAGASWDALVARAVLEGWSGVEALSGIPGSVGATPMQNVGAYGQEVSDTITRVSAYDRHEKQFVDFAAEKCAFSYRSSRFRGDDRFVITAVDFVFDRDTNGAPVRYAELSRELGIAEGERTSAARIRETVIRLRRGKGMVVDATDPESVSAGSFFTNPIVDAAVVASITSVAGIAPPAFASGSGKFKVPAAWLIERAGFNKGEPAGRVGISKKHALALVNRGGATTEDLLAVARSIRDGVKAKFGVELEVEPILVSCKI
ncbi:MAG: UDP-N-acetylmuramate dehydrogenase [Polyangiaceae bacterium]